MKTKLKYLVIVSIVLGGCHSDLYTKRMAEDSLKNEKPVHLIAGFLDLEYTENEGAIFGLFHDITPEVRRPLLIFTALIMTIAIALFIFHFRKRSLWSLMPYLLILSGALGNLSDRIQSDYVVDFIHFHLKDHFHWAVFNVADIYITVGMLLMLSQTLISKRDPFRLKDK